ncbi:MAG: tRNA (adenosine(37)-N6)-threonylcarbamoyltransferase complex dimerization subunit type 1 TsaB [Dehalococcoidia bacterium]
MELGIDCADDRPGIALVGEGEVVRMVTWVTERNHSVELLPAIDRLLAEGGVDKHALTGVLVDVGPGGYAGLRVGVSIAKALAHALGAALAGVGRLELDAYAATEAGERRRTVAVHRAGRGEVAWAAYAPGDGGWREELAPRISKPEALAAAIEAGDALTGDVDDELRAVAEGRGASVVAPEMHRVAALAALGHRRIAEGRTDDPRALVPLYLRGPAIGPQRP